VRASSLQKEEAISVRTRTLALALAIAGALLTGGVATATPGPNGHNDYGLCKAYFAGSDQGQERKHQAPPFRALEDAADEADQSVEEYCEAVTPGGK
jgi:hypothetical protein